MITDVIKKQTKKETMLKMNEEVIHNLFFTYYDDKVIIEPNGQIRLPGIK